MKHSILNQHKIENEATEWIWADGRMLHSQMIKMYATNIVEGRGQTINLLTDENFITFYEANPRIATLRS